jgi:Neutral/alkaline non-lysosomal ceramidase, N-terminal
MRKIISLISFAMTFTALPTAPQSPDTNASAGLQVGAAAVKITPYGTNPDWNGPVTESGVWGEKFVDANHNGRWDEGEAFTVDPGNAQIDPKSANRYAGIYLAGFGDNRMATGMHDDLWARALVLESGTTKIAIVSLDLIGYTQDGGYFGLELARKRIDPKLGIQEVLLTCTHDHEGPDTIGIWGANQVSDGKFPEYLQFVDKQIATAVTLAAKSLAPVRLKLGATNPKLSPVLAQMQTRTAGRPPEFFDEEMRVMQFVGATGDAKGKVAATLVNWNTHPESMESENTVLTSDFPGTVRDELEKRYGGTAVYITGDLGAVEIVGDNQRSTRTTFDGKAFPMDPKSKRASFTFARTEAIGRDVVKAAIDAVEHGEWSEVKGIEVKQAELRVPMDNAGYAALMHEGVLAPPATWKTSSGMQVVTKVYSVRFGDAQILTAPGELFPEVFYGVAGHRRNDCPAADTGRAPEPALRPLMTAKYKFVFGLSPEELGYLVPGYDFHAPTFSETQGLKEAADPCAASGVPAHYHETNSASSQLATGYACVAAELLSGKPAEQLPCK